MKNRKQILSLLLSGFLVLENLQSPFFASTVIQIPAEARMAAAESEERVPVAPDGSEEEEALVVPGEAVFDDAEADGSGSGDFMADEPGEDGSADEADEAVPGEDMTEDIASSGRDASADGDDEALREEIETEDVEGDSAEPVYEEQAAEGEDFSTETVGAEGTEILPEAETKPEAEEENAATKNRQKTSDISEEAESGNNPTDDTFTSEDGISGDGDEEIVTTDAALGIVDEGTCGDNVTWTLDDQGTLTIRGTGKMSGFPTWDKDSVKRAVIKSGVTYIGQSSFSGCASLESITIPKGVKTIWDSAFNDCRSLKQVVIPDGVTMIGPHAFRGCSSIENLEIPPSVLSIWNGAFTGCSSLASIVIPSTVQSINGSGMFLGCSSLINVTLPSNLKIIDSRMFSDCISLTNITIPSSVTEIEEYAFSGCTHLENIKIPSGVKSIGDMAFFHCDSLTGISIPAGVESIGYGVCASCSHLKEITVNGANKNFSSQDGVLFDRKQTTLLCYPAGISDLYYEIPASVTSVGAAAFYDCESLECILIPSGVKTIEHEAFYNCSDLLNIIIPSSMSNINYNAFYYCDNLEDCYYTGTQKQWEKIDIDEGNYPLSYATIHYSFNGTINVDYIELNQDYEKLACGKTLKLIARPVPANATNQTITWTSNAPSIASVDDNGLVTAKKYGTAVITAQTANGLTATCEIQVLFADVANSGKSYFKPVYWAVDRGITVVTVNFRPEDPVTRGEFVAFLWRVAGKPKSSAKVSFKDINARTKFYDAIRWAVGQGIIKGYSDDTFKSDNNVTRGETATMLWRYAGKPVPKSTKSPFSDIKASKADSYKAILWGSENGIIKGSKGQFLKNDGCTRGQVVTFLYRYIFR